MNANKKNGNGWILCSSKSFPGKFYYFNVRNGETAWSINDIEIKSFNKHHNVQQIIDKSYCYPEPINPPDEYRSDTSAMSNSNSHTFRLTNNTQKMYTNSKQAKVNQRTFSQTQDMFPKYVDDTQTWNKPFMSGHQVVNRKVQNYQQLPVGNESQAMSQQLYMNQTQPFLNQQPQMVCSQVDSQPQIPQIIQTTSQLRSYNEQPLIDQQSQVQMRQQPIKQIVDQQSPIMQGQVSQVFNQQSPVMQPQMGNQQSQTMNQRLKMQSQMDNKSSQAFNQQVSITLAQMNNQQNQPFKQQTPIMLSGVENTSHCETYPNFYQSTLRTQRNIISNETEIRPSSNQLCQPDPHLFVQMNFTAPLSKRFKFQRTVVNNENVFSSLIDGTAHKEEPSAIFKGMLNSRKRIYPESTPTFLEPAQKMKKINELMNISKDGITEIMKAWRQIEISPKKHLSKETILKIQNSENTFVSNDTDSSIFSFRNKVRNSIVAIQKDNKFLQGGEVDLRHVLLEKKRKIDSDNNIQSVAVNKKLNETPKKKVNFALDYQSDHSKSDIEQIPRGLGIRELKNLAKPLMKIDRWYIVVDTEALIKSFKFIERFVRKDASCRLLVPHIVKSDIEKISRGDHLGRAHVIVARQLLRRLATSAPHIEVQSPSEYDVNMSSIDCILNCCLEILSQKYHGILVTDNEKLYQKAKAIDLHCYKLQYIKDNDAASNTKVTFAFKKVNTDTEIARDSRFSCIMNPFARSDKRDFCNRIFDVPKTSQTTTLNVTNTEKNQNTEEICNKKDVGKIDTDHTSESLSGNAEDGNTGKEIEDAKETKQTASAVENVKYINDYNLDDYLKMFCVKNKLMETRAKSRQEEWMCILTQTLEDLFTDILQISSKTDPKLRPPWLLLDSVHCVTITYSKNTNICTIAKRLLTILGSVTNYNGRLNPNMNADDVMRLVGLGVLLVQSLKETMPLNKDLYDAELRLVELLKKIEDPSTDPTPDDEVTIEKTVRGNERHHTKYFVKNPLEVLNYLKKNFSQWKTYEDGNKIDDLRRNTLDAPLKIQNLQSTIVCAEGKDLNKIKIARNKNTQQTNKQMNMLDLSIPIHGNTFGVVEEKNQPKVIRQIKLIDAFEEKFKRISKKNIDNCKLDLEALNYSDIASITQDQQMGNQFSEDADEFCSDTNNINKSVTKESNQSVSSYVRNDVCNEVSGCLNKNSKGLMDIKKINNSTQNKSDQKINNKIHKDSNNFITTISKDHMDIRKITKLVTNNIKTETDQETEIGSQITKDANFHVSSEVSGVSKGVRSIKNTSPIILSNNITFNKIVTKDVAKNAVKDNMAADDVTDDSGIEIENIPGYVLVGAFFSEVLEYYKELNEFLTTNFNSLQSEQMQDNKRRNVHGKADAFLRVIKNLIMHYKSIIERESKKSTSLIAILARKGIRVLDDGRMKRYRTTIKLFMETAQVYKKSFKMLLKATKERKSQELNIRT